MGDDRQTIAALNINRSLTVFLQYENPNGMLDNPEEAVVHAEAIKKTLEGDMAHMEWVEKYGAENLEAWQKQFTWLSEPENFELYKNWSYEAVVLRDYLMARHFYQDPTRYIIETASDHCKDSPGCYGVMAEVATHKAYEMPPSDAVEEAIFKLCKASGSAENAIAFIEKFKEAYPDQFYGGMKAFLGVNPDKEFFSGKNPEQLAFGLNTAADLAGRKDIISFIAKIDDILGWRFSFQKAPAYLRFHDMWLERGDALLAELRQRKEIENFFKRHGHAQKLDDHILERLAGQDRKLFNELKKLIETSGGDYRTFFNMLMDEESMGYSGDGFAQRLDDFLGLLDKRGGGFLKEVHRLSDLPSAPELRLVPYYRLIDAISDLGGDINEILPMISDTLLNSEKEYPDNYWSYDEFAYILAWRSYFGSMVHDNFPITLARPIVELYKRGLLRSKLAEFREGFGELDNLDAMLCKTLYWGNKQRKYTLVACEKSLTTYYYSRIGVILALLGNETSPADCEVNSVRCEIVNSAIEKVDFEGKGFWSGLSAQVGVYLPFISQNWTFLADNSIKRDYAPFISRATKPSAEEMKRFDRWLDKAAEHFNLSNTEGAIGTFPQLARVFKRYILKHLILSQNGKVPSEKELETFDREVLSSGAAEQFSEKAYLAMYFYANPLGDLWEKAPQMTRALTKAFLSSVHFAVSSDEVRPFIGALKNTELRERLGEIEAELNGLEKEKREAFLDIFFNRIKWNSNDNDPKRVISKLDKIRLFFNENDSKVMEFADNIKDKKFAMFKAFTVLFEFYKDKGAEGLKQSFSQWERIGLTTEEFYGNKRLLELSENDIERAQDVEGLFAKNGRGLFLILPEILDLDETTYQNWLSFIKELVEHEIYLPVRTVLTIRTIPNILPLLILLKGEGVLDRALKPPRGYYTPQFIDLAFGIFSEKELPLLAEDIPLTRKYIKKLKARFNGYLFDEFTRVSIIPKSPIMLIPTLADMVNFDLKLKEGFFKKHREVQNIYDDYTTIVTGTPVEYGAHPFLDDDPDNPFKISDHSLYKYALNNRTYPKTLGGMSREDIIENLLAQFTKMSVETRKENKIYAAREYASRDILESLPLAQLIKIQWLLNNLGKASFRKQINELLEKDRADPNTEYGGFLMQKSGQPEISSLFEPMELINVPAGDLDKKRSMIELLDSNITATADPKEVESLKNMQKAMLAEFDGGYNTPQSTIETRFGWHLAFHLHSTSEAVGNSADYSGPSGGADSGGDIETTYVLGDSVVFTRLGLDKFNADIYGLIPHTTEEQFTTWSEFVIDLGVYDDSAVSSPP